MKPRLVALFLAFWAVSSPAQSAEGNTAAPGHYLFVWAGDRAHKGNDFLAVIDADPSSASYGRLVTTLATEQQPGFSFAERDWPHGWKGVGAPHGAVFTR